MKIAVLGFSGSGKSTCSKRLAQILNIPVLYLDQVQFMPGWKERNLVESLQLVRDFMNQENWIIDGNYNSFDQKERLENADVILYFLFPRRTCLKGVLQRYFTNRNKTRESMAQGCLEKLDFEFLKWVLIDGRNKKTRQKIKRICDQYHDKTVIFTNHKQVEKYCSSLKEIELH